MSEPATSAYSAFKATFSLRAYTKGGPVHYEVNKNWTCVEIKEERETKEIGTLTVSFKTAKANYENNLPRAVSRFLLKRIPKEFHSKLPVNEYFRGYMTVFPSSLLKIVSCKQIENVDKTVPFPVSDQRDIKCICDFNVENFEVYGEAEPVEWTINGYIPNPKNKPNHILPTFTVSAHSPQGAVDKYLANNKTPRTDQ